MIMALLLIMAQQTERVPWPASVAYFSGWQVNVETEAGGRIRGNWVAISPDTFTVKTKAGFETHPRSIIKNIRMEQGRWWTGTLGFIAGYTVATGLVLRGVPGPGLVMVIGSATAGTWLGDKAGRKRRVVVLYDPPK